MIQSESWNPLQTRCLFYNLGWSFCIICSVHKRSRLKEIVNWVYTLWHTATHCNTLQHTATLCNTLQHTATHCNRFLTYNIVSASYTLQHIATHGNTLQHIATHCNTLQPTATHCNILQHTAAHCNRFFASHIMNASGSHLTHCIPLQRTATHCTTLQHTATASAKLFGPHPVLLSMQPRDFASWIRFLSSWTRNPSLGRKQGDSLNVNFLTGMAPVNAVCCNASQCVRRTRRLYWDSRGILRKCILSWECCSVRQCVAVCYSVFQCVRCTHDILGEESIAVCCIVLQCDVVCCSVLQCVAVCTMHSRYLRRRICCSVLHCLALSCSVLQCVRCTHDIWGEESVAVGCIVLQCNVVCCSVSPTKICAANQYSHGPATIFYYENGSTLSPLSRQFKQGFLSDLGYDLAAWR